MNMLCFGMEAAGLMDHSPYLVASTAAAHTKKSFSTLYLEVRSLAHARSARLPRRRVSELAEVCHELPVERKLNSQIPV
jgi:hypothetical protein